MYGMKVILIFSQKFMHRRNSEQVSHHDGEFYISGHFAKEMTQTKF
jgi:hypothetical protein